MRCSFTQSTSCGKTRASPSIQDAAQSASMCRQQQLLSFQSSNEEVLDVQWCPSNSTVFGAVTAGGRLQLWDFSVSTLTTRGAAYKHQVLHDSLAVCSGEHEVVSAVLTTEAASAGCRRLLIRNATCMGGTCVYCCEHQDRTGQGLGEALATVVQAAHRRPTIRHQWNALAGCTCRRGCQ